MKTLIIAGLMMMSRLMAADAVGGMGFQPSTDSSVKLWRASIAALAVANVMDVHSSWGKHELNSTLSGSNGRFGAQGAGIKLGIQAGLVGVEYLLTRGHHHPRVYRLMSYINFSAGTVIGATAIHNYGIARPR